MAYRMQTSVPDLTNVSDEPESTFELYGDDARPWEFCCKLFACPTHGSTWRTVYSVVSSWLGSTYFDQGSVAKTMSRRRSGISGFGTRPETTGHAG